MLENQTILDESLDFDKKKEYELSILIAESGLSLYVLDAKQQKLLAWKWQAYEDASADIQEKSFYLSKFLKKGDLISDDYAKVRVIYVTPKSLLIPTAFYNDDNRASLFGLNHKIAKGETVHRNTISVLESEKLFAVPNVITEVLQKYFETYTLYHHTDGILSEAQQKKAYSTAYVFVSDTFLSVNVFDDEKLVLDNSFHYQAKEDALYYLLYLYNQLGLNPKTQKTVLYLNIPLESDLLKLFNTYLGNIVYAEYPKEFSYNHLFKSSLSPYLASQILTFKCE